MSLSKKKLFGTNGIRGIFGNDLSIEFIIDVSYSIGSFFNKGSIVLGYDGRSSSFAISKIVSSVLMSLGIDVYDIGLAPTPCLQFTVKNSKFAGGIMITASHNPPEYNGLKPISSTGVELSREEELFIEEIYYQNRFTKITNLDFGNLFILEDALEKYIDKVLSLIDVDAIKRYKFKIVMDFGNRVQSLVAPLIAKKLGCEILIINGNIDGNFSARGSEPKADNLNNLTELVKKTNADMGVAYDGDGDRSIFCDEKGIIHWGDKTGSLLTYYLIKNKKIETSVVCPVNSSTVISKICNDLNNTVIFTKVGSVEVTHCMKNTNSIIGFEENGGFFYGLLNYVRDGAITTALILEMLSYYKQNPSEINLFANDDYASDSDISLSRIFKIFDNTYQYKSSLKLSNSDEIPKALDLCKNHGSVKKIENIDGIKIWFDNESWIMFRPSGTEPLLRIYAESDDKFLLDSKVKEYEELIKKSFPI
ncbi:MAG: phosphoglucosamine mutase [Thermoproteota archaeon]|nr:phosphoglucosamine mutase [Thermoproteota archaeon]